MVTGASGFIGKHLVNTLEGYGFRVNILVRNSRNYNNVIGDVCIFEGDIIDSDIVKKAIDNVEIVFHLVAKTHDFSKNIDNAKDYFKINVEGTENLLDACISSKVKHFVYFSSVKTMGEVSKYTLNETYDCTPTTPYGESKLAAEKLVVDYGNKYGFRTTIIRLPLVYGPGNKGNVYKMIEAIDNGRFVMIGKGINKRSMVYVQNVVDAALSVVDQKAADKKVYIITDGVDYSMKELYRLIAKGLSKKPLPFYVPMGIATLFAIAGDIWSKTTRRPSPFDSDILGKLTGLLTFSSRRIKEELGFKPKYNFYNTLDKTIKWYNEEKSNA